VPRQQRGTHEGPIGENRSGFFCVGGWRSSGGVALVSLAPGLGFGGSGNAKTSDRAIDRCDRFERSGGRFQRRPAAECLALFRNRLDHFDEVTVGIIERPQSSLSDFYRELGSVFGVQLSIANRYGGFQALRDRWREHINSTLLRPVLPVDEAQQVQTDCLNEIRLLGSDRFDSKCLLTTVLCGDTRLLDRFRSPELLPLGSRIATRFKLTSWNTNDLRDFLDHALDEAGAPHLMCDGLKDALVEHAAGN